MTEDYLERSRAQWISAIGRTFLHPLSSREICGSPEIILQVLQPLLGQGVSHAFFSSGGGLDFLRGEVGPERGGISLVAAEQLVYRMKPRRLAFHYIDEAPGESFVYLDLALDSPSGVYSTSSLGAEEVVDLGDANYVDRSVWDQGFLRYDHDGNEVRLPKEALLAVRILGGSILFVHHGSIWNRTSRNYDGIVQSQGEGAILAAIRSAIRR